MKSHRFDALSFVSGLVAVAIGLVFLIPAEPGQLFDYVFDVGSWFWPVLLIAIGVAVLAPLASSRRRPGDEDDQED